jgi:hypothetical protein
LQNVIKVEIIIDVHRLHLAPRMLIVFPIYSLQLTKMAIQIVNKQKFKEDIIIDRD